MVLDFILVDSVTAVTNEDERVVVVLDTCRFDQHVFGLQPHRQARNERLAVGNQLDAEDAHIIRRRTANRERDPTFAATLAASSVRLSARLDALPT